MAKMTIKIVHEQHFIDGDRFHAYLEQPETRQSIIVACAVKPDDYLNLCEKLGGLKWRLTDLGNDVSVVNKFEPDPNFETYEDAMEYMENKGA